MADNLNQRARFRWFKDSGAIISGKSDLRTIPVNANSERRKGSQDVQMAWVEA